MIMTETEQAVKCNDENKDKYDDKDRHNDKYSIKTNENGCFSEEDLHVLEIKDPDNLHKCISISGLCINCDKKCTCGFIRGFAVLTKDESAKPVVDYELSIYSCDNYPRKDNDCVYCSYPKRVRMNEVKICQ